MAEHVRLAVRVEGVVQGVGFRPFIYGLAHRLGLSGHVGNDARGVFAEIEGTAHATEAFLVAVRTEAPPLSFVDTVRARPMDAAGTAGFSIVTSWAGGEVGTSVPADSATCEDCLTELADPSDRRYRYPFVNCTNCGPRFTIVRGVPYDRALTTMARFAMCADCAREYHNPGNRRFHAQPVCCPACGPRLRLVMGEREVHGDAVSSTVELLRAGAVVALKGLGGYHLAVDAGSESATAALRSRKHREDKPFAVMVPDLTSARRLCAVNEVAQRLLTGWRRPIVLLPRLRDAPIAPSLAPGNRQLGLMLPYTPLHHLLLADLAGPIVLTSANVSDEPIVHRDTDVFERLRGIADAVLCHDRAIHIRTDDSVVRPFRGREQVQRRSRGYVPEPVTVEQDFPRHVLGCGAELKNTFCLAKGGTAFLSQHIGDLENYETLRSYTDGIEHLRTLLDIDPVLVAHDLHPEYLSTKYARDLDDVELLGVQHHHAHIASCLVDNRERGPVLGVAFDGLGYGPDGSIWGGEFLLADLAGFRRVGHLAPVPMPGGTAAIKQPWRMAASYLDAGYASGPPATLDVVRRHEARWSDVVALARGAVNSPMTSSAGRLLDAISAILGVRDTVNYEGQAAIELEQYADPDESGVYRVDLRGDEPIVVSGVDLVRSCVDDLRAGVPRPVIAARVHNGMVDAITRTCVRLRDATGVEVVALSGGVFQNLLLLDRTVEALQSAGLRVLTHSRVPTNDGGISLGQVAVAGEHDRRYTR
ncbi:hydrogenase maturation protein HypF [Amycolatopsis marina]|uniref:Carbamoyltransferase n=1 Tax=Amycolatopsis marina TaxID=490629 RepID=A0A1I1C3G6_9PSEU|nr:carbamoyltransferase HypF [Amycolatopsis marina]SFB56907.1 hydrogenase maturation protein HypF [Amycolatopsis marina]